MFWLICIVVVSSSMKLVVDFGGFFFSRNSDDTAVGTPPATGYFDGAVDSFRAEDF